MTVGRPPSDVGGFGSIHPWTAPKPNDQAGGAQAATKPSIDSLRTVEFRTTLRGYHMDDVDEYLERVAVEAEALQEQMRLASDRVKQATERVSRASNSNWSRPAVQSSAAAEPQPASRAHRVPPRRAREVTDDSLQRTLMLAQKFVDQTRQEAEDEANAARLRVRDTCRAASSLTPRSMRG